MPASMPALADFKKKLAIFKTWLTPQVVLDGRIIDAIEKGSADDLKKAIANGGNPNAAQSGRRSVAGLAAEKGSAEMIDILAAAKIDMNVRVNYGAATPLSIAAVRGDVDVIRAMVRAGASLHPDAQGLNPPIVAAAAAGKYQAVEALLDTGADIYARDRYGFSALSHAVRRGDQKMMTLLCDRKADIDILDNDMRSLLDIAEEYKRPLAYDFIQRKMDEAVEPWQLTGAEQISNVSVMRKLGYRLTQTFNFETRQIITKTSNLQNDSEAVAAVSMDAPDQSASVSVAKAQLELKKTQMTMAAP